MKKNKGVFKDIGYLALALALLCLAPVALIAFTKWTTIIWNWFF